MVQGIDNILNGLKQVQTNDQLKEQSTKALSFQLKAAGLTDNEQQVVIGYYLNAETADKVSTKIGVTKEEVNNNHESAIRKLSMFPPLQHFVNQVKEYLKSLPK